MSRDRATLGAALALVALGALTAAPVAAEPGAPATQPAVVAAPPPPPPPRSVARFLTLSGYLQPEFGFKYRARALPGSRWEYGPVGGRTGIIFTGEPLKGWSYVAHLVIDGNVISSVTGVDAVDRNGDGAVDTINVSRRSVISTLLEETTINYQPVRSFALKAGHFRIPFSLENASPNTALMFPSRAGPNEVFVSGADWGALAVTYLGAGLARAAAGVFRGDSLGFQPVSGYVRGLVLAARADVNPLGPFPFEGNLKREPFRLGLGAGLLYRPATQYDWFGNAQTPIDDWRVCATLRLSLYGVYLQGEYLRRWQFDAVSSRPQVADGFYAQGFVLVRVRPWLAVAPIGRVGFTRQDLGFDPRRVLWTETGLAFYPVANHPEKPNVLRLTLQYQGERRLDEGESAHGAALQIQLLWW
ncbi:MAG TPA: hypothetical protein VGQ83_07260 [Polyangia bacterium]